MRRLSIPSVPTPYESARLNLELFALRREPALREARACFLGEFTPRTFAELVALAGGERNAAFRVVLGYWDMAALARRRAAALAAAEAHRNAPPREGGAAP